MLFRVEEKKETFLLIKAPLHLLQNFDKTLPVIWPHPQFIESSSTYFLKIVEQGRLVTYEWNKLFLSNYSTNLPHFLVPCWKSKTTLSQVNSHSPLLWITFVKYLTTNLQQSRTQCPCIEFAGIFNSKALSLFMDFGNRIIRLLK